MRTRRPNPYDSPSAKQSQGSVSVRWLPLSLPTCVHVLALTTVVVSQVLLRRRFTIMEMELPYSTEVAMGPLVPAVIGILTLITLATKLNAFEQYRNRWDIASVVFLGLAVSFYAIACLLPFTTGPTELSLHPNLLAGVIALPAELMAEGLTRKELNQRSLAQLQTSRSGDIGTRRLRVNHHGAHDPSHDTPEFGP